jgi:hypothetical protein
LAQSGIPKTLFRKSCRGFQNLTPDSEQIADDFGIGRLLQNQAGA